MPCFTSILPAFTIVMLYWSIFPTIGFMPSGNSFAVIYVIRSSYVHTVHRSLWFWTLISGLNPRCSCSMLLIWSTVAHFSLNNVYKRGLKHHHFIPNPKLGVNTKACWRPVLLGHMFYPRHSWPGRAERPGRAEWPVSHPLREAAERRPWAGFVDP